ncbi:MAG: hypothetical protein KatS3mg105_0925 [Gemmatales bacterium]|nr:MAG: hypothetical protein KatS3mg105_0925 [Gemmatales bacterium]
MRRKRGGEEGPEVELPITPMLDMAFQLLTFFIFTYQPSAMEGHMDLMLPASGEAKADRLENVSTDVIPDKEIGKESELKIKVGTALTGDNVGQITSLEVEGFTGPQAFQTVDQLRRFLTDEHKKLADSGGSSAVKIECQNKVKWSATIQVMDACKKAGFENISFAPPEDGG